MSLVGMFNFCGHTKTCSLPSESEYFYPLPEHILPMQIKKAFTISPQLFFNMQANLGRVPTAHPNVKVFNVYTSYWAENFNSVWKQAFPQISLNTLDLTSINTSLELPEIFGKEQKLFSWFWSHSLSQPLPNFLLEEFLLYLVSRNGQGSYLWDISKERQLQLFRKTVRL